MPRKKEVIIGELSIEEQFALELERISGIRSLDSGDIDGVPICVIDMFGTEIIDATKSKVNRKKDHGRKVCTILERGRVNLIQKIEINRTPKIESRREPLTSQLRDMLEALEEVELKSPLPQVVNFSIHLLLSEEAEMVEASNEHIAMLHSKHGIFAKINSVFAKKFYHPDFDHDRNIRKLAEEINDLEIKIVKKMLNLRKKGVVFVSPLPNYPKGSFFNLSPHIYSNPLIHSQCITVTGLTYDDIKQELMVIGYPSVPPDVLGVSFWNEGDQIIEGNSFASPMVSLGVAMILSKPPVELYIGFDQSTPPIGKSEVIKDRIIQILNKNTSEVKTDNGIVSCLDLKKLKNYLNQDRN